MSEFLLALGTITLATLVILSLIAVVLGLLCGLVIVLWEITTRVPFLRRRFLLMIARSTR
jgi:hypothetical protein